MSQTTTPTPLRDRVAGAPISWGVCEVPGWGHQLGPALVLGQMREVGLAATEFGPDGFLPDSPKDKARTLADAGHYPAIDIEQSISRAMVNLIAPAHLDQGRTPMRAGVGHGAAAEIGQETFEFGLRQDIVRFHSVAANGFGDDIFPEAPGVHFLAGRLPAVQPFNDTPLLAAQLRPPGQGPGVWCGRASKSPKGIVSPAE